ncbi:hypothetical protein [Flavobacterium weaverense]|uniref:ParB-like nuclease family protein n=1 Tax=Flavobacterium weaverense TaxID=271156 RepID=A0A3L9ZNR0_9FLAO|nr:hypothetical protein [Flavobacterium weaverense]RMA73059.1 hypothetical protein BC961_2661 [Flavobacterium weaverense]
MKATRDIEYKNVEELTLDINNPRFAELYVGNGSEDNLIQYLLDNEAGIEVAKSIIAADEFYSDRPLWVLKKGHEYIVKDGNRRCAAVKALQLPGKFAIDLPKTIIEEVPIIVYDDEEDLNKRIFLEHANNTFRSWERIAQAIEVYKLFKSGTDLKLMSELDSQPGQLIKLASFYKAAVIYGEDSLKKLLTRGRGRTGGRTIIFERLFKYSDKCGYKFKAKPSFEISIHDETKFKSYILSLINLLESDLGYEIKTDTIDGEKEDFMSRLKPYGFDYFFIESDEDKQDIEVAKSDNSDLISTGESIKHTAGKCATENENVNSNENYEDKTDIEKSYNNGSTTNEDKNNNSLSAVKNSGKRGSTKTKPTIVRKKIPAGVRNRISECYGLPAIQNPIAKLALVRIVYECTLKYIVEHTHYSSKNKLPKSNHFQSAYRDKKNIPYPSTNFDELHKNFIKLIKNQGMKRTFENFKMDQLQQIIHNYNAVGIPTNATNYCAELIPILDFLLADENVFLSSIDLTNIS